ncbi:MAG TPA: OmpA family protein [Acidobacteriaceae bacterium]|nr:OmpA family protein [Acidobacteriaceae bacterium]
MANRNATVLASSTVAALVFAATLSLSAQSTSSPQAADTQQQPSPTAQNPQDNSTYATGKPLPTKTNEGFWGHLNPLARKKWVNRQVGPVKDRLNELDQLSAKNANDIKDLDTRATAGIEKAQTTADGANQLATTANTQAGQASQMAQQASTQTNNLNTTVSNLDQYAPIADTEIRFRGGQTVLNAKAKEALDDVATKLQGQKGYIVEVQGYSRARGQAGIANSQHMADAVVRYLVVEHNIPVYRIYRVALGNAPVDDSDKTARGSLVHVTLMHNSLAALSGSSPDGSSPIGATQQSPSQPSPQGAASQPVAQPQQ